MHSVLLCGSKDMTTNEKVHFLVESCDGIKSAIQIQQAVFIKKQKGKFSTLGLTKYISLKTYNKASVLSKGNKPGGG